MRKTLLIAALAAFPLPLQAQEAAPVPPDGQSDAQPEDQKEQGRSLIEEGAKLFLRGMLQEMAPHLRDTPDMSGFPNFAQLQELAKLLGDFSNYQMPEVLSNGDVLIRRKPEAPPRLPAPDEPEVGAGGEVDL